MLINDNYRIRDMGAECFCVERRYIGEKGKSLGVVKWKELGYYSSCQDALKGAVKKMVNDMVEPSKDLVELITKVDELQTYMKERVNVEVD